MNSTTDYDYEEEECECETCGKPAKNVASFHSYSCMLCDEHYATEIHDGNGGFEKALEVAEEEEEEEECDRCGKMKSELGDVNGKAWCEECVDEYNEDESDDEELECVHCGKKTSMELDCGGYDPCCIMCWTHYARPREDKESWEDYTGRLPFKVEGDERVITKEEIREHLEKAME